MPRTPLHAVHVDLGATFGDDAGWEMPRTYAGVAAEYHAARTAAVLADRSHHGRLRMTGNDRLDILHRLSTNALLDMRPGEGRTTILTTNKGRIIDLLLVLNLPEHSLILTGQNNAQKVREWIEKFIITEDCAIADISGETGQLALGGPQAAATIRAALNTDASSLAPYHFASTPWGSDSAILFRGPDLAGAPSFHLIAGHNALPGVWRTLLEEGRPLGLAPIGTDAYEVLRIEAGIPALGAELSEDHNPLEARLLSSISFAKGCYVGQEVIARLNTYQKVQRYLVSLRFAPAAVPARGTPIRLDGRTAGHITSAALSPATGAVVALGYMQAEDAKAGAPVIAAWEHGLLQGEITSVLER
ncbi:MAG: aminomethyl transferase family protein [Chloroflexi bacterium]|nr:aminomethyl transferase family protein [Chloroflexota bacterium]